LGLEHKKSSVDDGTDQTIKDVWLGNFFEAMEKIGSLVDKYPYIAMVSTRQIGFLILTFSQDTEYPGTVYLPPDTENEFEY